MKRRIVQRRKMLVLVGLLVVAAAVSLSVASAKPRKGVEPAPLAALPPGGRPEAVAFDPRSPQIVYVMTQGVMTQGHVFKTADGGAHWQATATSGSGWGEPTKH